MSAAGAGVEAGHPSPEAPATTRPRTLRRWLDRVADPLVVIPLLTVAMLAVLWITTTGMVRLEYAKARAAAIASTRELTDTYEAQAVRALREIDRTLRLVAYTARAGNAAPLLEELARQALLLPDFLFTVDIAGPDGGILASTAPGPRESAAGADYFVAQRVADAFVVGAPRPGSGGDEWTLSFCRRLVHPDGSFAGAVVISVAASYFVSGYEPAKLGRYGFIGLLGTDGILRAGRTGDTVSAGTMIPYGSVVPAPDAELTPVTLTVTPWDSEERYTAARELFEFPLAVVVGLSEAEQLRPAAAEARRYVLRAVAASAAIVAVMALLGTLGWQLQRSRHQAAEAQAAYAQRIEHMAQHDSLTGLPNRSYFTDLLQRMLALARRYERTAGVLFLDLDHFKQINDTLGHYAGDTLLQEVARRLGAAVRDCDIVARLAGDEFVVLLPERAEPANVELVARRILAALARPYDLRGHQRAVTVSVGAARFPQDAKDGETLLKCADAAMYRAKAQGRNGFRFYESDDSEPLSASAP